jgi:hypothetical protein
MRSARIIPNIDASPTITVIAISVEVNVPETILAEPSRNSQIAIISNNQKKKQGSATHLIHADRQLPNAIAI